MRSLCPCERSEQSKPGSRAAVLSQAGAPLPWTRERADTPFVCERVRKAAADKRQPQRALASKSTESEGTCFSSPSDDEVGGLLSASRSERSDQPNSVRARA